MPFSFVLLYTYYHGIIDHSGITFKRAWWQPWQPDCIFHDNHHQYFHVNFGFNIEYWDKVNPPSFFFGREKNPILMYVHICSFTELIVVRIESIMRILFMDKENPSAKPLNKNYKKISRKGFQKIRSLIRETNSISS